MKHGDRFLNRAGVSYILIETLGFWHLMGELTGGFWNSSGAETPIEAFGGKKWHNSFRKLPKFVIEQHTFNEEDRSYDVLYLQSEDGKDMFMSLDMSDSSRRNLLAKASRTCKFDELPEIED